MNLTVHGTEFSSVLGVVGQTIPTRAARPVLQNVALVAKDGKLELWGSDMEISIRHGIEDVEIEEEGSVLVNASRLQGIAKELVGGKVEIRAKDFHAEIRAPGCFFDLVGEDPTDFPGMPTAKAGKGTAEIGTKALASLVRRVAYAAAPEETRYAIHGVLLVMNGGKAMMVATDGKRLAWAGDQDLKDDKGLKSALIPPRGLRQILAAVPEGADKIGIHFEDRRIIAETDISTVVMSKIEGTFPQYREVVPKETTVNVEVSRSAFASSVRRAALLANEGSQAVQVKFTKGKVEVAARASNVGEGQIEMDLPLYAGKEIEIHFNPKYLLDFLKIAESETIKIGMNDARAATVMRDGDNLTYVVMPVTLEEANKP